MVQHMSSALGQADSSLEIAAGDTIKLVIVVLGYEKMVNSQASTMRVMAGEHQLRVEGAYRASVVGRVHTLLQSRGVDVQGIEQSADHDSFALLIHASFCIGGAQSLSELRHDLENSAKELGVTLRVQREELFTYMHRI